MSGGSAEDHPSTLSVVLTTVADRESGERLARRLVEERLIACGNLVPGLLSVFPWQGKISREEEVLLVMKAPSAGMQRLFARIAELHPYEVPELIALPVESVSEAYFRWVMESTEVNA